MTDVEKKIRLTRFLREENRRNQIRMKNREEILYGSGKPCLSEEDIQNVYDGTLEDSASIYPPKQYRSHSTFRIRAFMAAALFVLTVYLDKTGGRIGQKNADEWINQQLNWSAEAKLIDFMSSFPYTLADGQTSE